MHSLMLENWGKLDLQLTDIDGKQVSFKYGDVKTFNARNETIFSSEYYAAGGIGVVTFHTSKGKFRIPRTSENDTAILDMMLSRPKVYN